MSLSSGNLVLKTPVALLPTTQENKVQIKKYTEDHDEQRVTMQADWTPLAQSEQCVNRGFGVVRRSSMWAAEIS